MEITKNFNLLKQIISNGKLDKHANKILPQNLGPKQSSYVQSNNIPESLKETE